MVEKTYVTYNEVSLVIREEAGRGRLARACATAGMCLSVAFEGGQMQVLCDGGRCGGLAGDRCESLRARAAYPCPRA